MTTHAAGGLPISRGAPRLVTGLLWALLLTLLSYLVWTRSYNGSSTVGPFDSTIFFWAIALPLWLLAPVSAGYVWQSLARGNSYVGGALYGVAVGIGSAFWFWQASIRPDCSTGSVNTSLDWVFPAVLVGLAIGGGPALTSVLVARVTRTTGPWIGVLTGLGVGSVLALAGLLVTAGVLMGGGCNPA